MKRIVIALCLLAFSLRVVADESLRTWTSSSGSTLSAKLVKQLGGRVILEKEDGAQLTISLGALSAADRAYVKELQKTNQRLTSSAAKRGAKTPVHGIDDLEAEWMTEFELGVVREMNLARLDPAGYATHLERYRAKHIGNNIFATKRGNLKTQEGLAAVDEAIAFLKEAKPLDPMMPSEGLSLSAKVHADDTGPKGVTGHTGTDGSTSQQRIEKQGTWKGRIGENISYGSHDARGVVMSLIIDDGVPSRGHRVNIFSPHYKVAGVAVGDHKIYRVMCVINYAGGFKKK